MTVISVVLAVVVPALSGCGGEAGVSAASAPPSALTSSARPSASRFYDERTSLKSERAVSPSEPRLKPSDLARDMAKAVFGDNVRLWRFYETRTHKGPVRLSWQPGVERSKEDWAVRLVWDQPGRKRIARWKIELPLAEMADNPPEDVELDDKVLADNAQARRLTTIPRAQPLKGRRFGLFVSVGDAASDGRNLKLVVSTVASDIPTRYTKMGDEGVALLRGNTWISRHHVDSKPRHILLNEHTRIESRDSAGAHSVGWLVAQLRKHPIEAAAVWSTPPASVPALGSRAVQRLIIDPDYRGIG